MCVFSVCFYHSYVCFRFCYFFFFFKQKTAYEMRISDWSSDVCSSDLQSAQFAKMGERNSLHRIHFLRHPRLLKTELGGFPEPQEIGRASCRERVCQYV